MPVSNDTDIISMTRGCSLFRLPGIRCREQQICETDLYRQYDY